MKILVALSGGVDSAVAALLLKKDGHEVIGATMQLNPLTETNDAADAQKIAESLSIPHHIFDFRDIFAGTIIDYFCREYRQGRTPNPCVMCNRFIKFGILWEKAREIGAEAIATGHYAAVEKKNNRYILKKGADREKDQSYFLYRLTQEQLSRTVFPLARLTKAEVKLLAEENSLPAVDRPESQEICFVPDDDYTGFLKEYTYLPDTSGPIIDQSGRKLGDHQGIVNFTIGQRKGLGIASSTPLYVTGIDAATNTVKVGTKEQTYGKELTATDLNWIAVDPPEGPFQVKARIRYRHREANTFTHPVNDHAVRVEFWEPQMSITPGQSVVFYEGDTVIGGGVITKQGR